MLCIPIVITHTMQESEFVIVKNQKNNDCLLFNGHRYNKTKHVNKTLSTIWRCANKEQCNATITVDVNRENILRQSRHTCKADLEKNTMYMKLNELKEEVCMNLEPIRKLFDKSFENIDGFSLSNIPKFDDKKDSLYRARKKFLGAERLTFHSIEEEVIPEVLQKDFLVTADSNEKKILVFATKLSRKLLKSSKSFFADGTFKITPKPFYQVFTIHADLYSDDDCTNIVPVVYTLLPDKSQDTYTRLFNILKNIGMEINKFKCDYERSIMNAVKVVYPEARITGCFFHFQKAIWKKARELNVTNTMEEKNIIKKVGILPLLPATFIPEGWQNILEEMKTVQTMDRFQKYFEKYWYPGKHSTAVISCEGQRHRTTNALEGWHHRINGLIPKHSTLFYFIHKLRKEANRIDTKIKKCLFEPARQTRRKRDINYDKKYQAVLNNLNNREISVNEFLEEMIHYQLV